MILLVSSCSKDDSNGSQDSLTDKQNSCLPFIENNTLLQDISIIPVDPSTTIVSHRQEGDCLILDTRFDGGCEEHLLQLVIDVDNMDALNLSQSLFAILWHENTDPCEARIAYELEADISKLKELEQDELSLIIDGYSELITIIF